MKLEEYLFETESVTEQMSAYDDVDAVGSSKRGTLACTPFRLVYVGKDNLTDISIDEVSAIEYNRPSYPTSHFRWGLVTMVIGFIFLLGWGGIENAPSTLGFGTLLLTISGIIIASAIAIFISGYFVRRAILKIHTPNKCYEFASKRSGLDEIAHTVRAYAIKNNQRVAR